MMRIVVLSALLLLTGVCLGGCERGQVEVDPLPTVVDAPVSVELGDQPYRPRRRMDIRQLENSIRRVTGGLEWRINSSTLGFDRYAATLGEPDYVQRTVEDRSVSVLFVKFLDDAARDVCDDLLDLEWQEDAEERVFLVHASMADTLPASAEAIGANLRYLLLRFHGRRVAIDSPQLFPWSELLERVAEASRGEEEGAEPDYEAAWESVCVSLINHPDFFTY